MADHGLGLTLTRPRKNTTMSSESKAAAQPQDHTKQVTIIVNGRPKLVDKERMAFEEIVQLAFPNAQLENPDFEYVVTYTRGHNDNQEGTLTKGKSVKVKEGMIFNVTETNKS
jgi:hypothetical protein